MISHPTVKKSSTENGNITHKVRLNDNCISCHSETELMDFNEYYPLVYRSDFDYRFDRFSTYYDPYYVYPWWYDIKITSTSVESSSPQRNYEGSLRNSDGSRSRDTNPNINLPPPSRNEDSNRATTQAKDKGSSSNDRKSDTSTDRRNTDNQNTNTRNNSGERKK